MTFEEAQRERPPLQRSAETKILALLNEQGEDLATLIEDEDHPVSAFFEKSGTERILTEVWTETIVHFAELTAKEIQSLKQTDEELDRWQQLVNRFIQTDGAVLIKDVNDTTIELVREFVTAGVNEGIGSREIARNLRKEWGEISRVRAERISRTETARASNYGSHEGAKEIAEQLGLELEKVWNTAPPAGNERDRHVLVPGLDGQVRKMDEPFNVNGHSAMYPGDYSLPPSESVNCRCAISHRVAEQKNWRDDRDAKMREQFPILKAKWGHVQAIDELAEQVKLSPRQVWRIVYQGTRS